ncbi:hypothetical protein FIBSPDRAFT_945138 [Athelia psychrophila]|uniref:Uncharacterized protein n=1 Tax=Athelia psychrophila TaxID=1759441 RepID=A0A166UF19_9AGAM|nr:hypothetical protein FIBSPDRAFT_945138 [Fibularhizoctonia sp. CBS 109695]
MSRMAATSSTAGSGTHATHVNVHEHIGKTKRQQGCIGSTAHDPAQEDARAFFGGEREGRNAGSGAQREQCER